MTLFEQDPAYPRLVRRASLAIGVAAVSEQDVVRHLRLALKDRPWRTFVDEPLPLLQSQDDRWVQHCLVELGILPFRERPQKSASDLSS